MSGKSLMFLSALIGAGAGILSTYPIALGPIPSLILWTVAGIIAGYLTSARDGIVWNGIVFGISLSFVFLFSRFGGTSDKLFGYTAFVAFMSVFGAIAGVITVFIGSWLKKMRAQ